MQDAQKSEAPIVAEHPVDQTGLKQEGGVGWPVSSKMNLTL